MSPDTSRRWLTFTRQDVLAQQQKCSVYRYNGVFHNLHCKQRKHDETEILRKGGKFMKDT